MEKYHQVPSFLNEALDMSEHVEANTINLAEAGVEPNVLYNNSSYPVTTTSRTDTPKALPLATYDTENTVVRNAELVELSYDKMESVIRGHRNALVNAEALRASFDFSPSSNGTYTPVLGTSGAVANSFKMITENDIIDLADKFDQIDAPDEGRILVLHPTHFNQLVKTSEVLKQQQGYRNAGVIDRLVLNLFGFKIHKYRGAAVFNKTTGVKAAYGATAAPSTDTIASFAFVNTEVMKAVGTTDMFATLKDPAQRGDIIGFQQRFIALPLRNKYQGAIYSAV